MGERKEANIEIEVENKERKSKSSEKVEYSETV